MGFLVLLTLVPAPSNALLLPQAPPGGSEDGIVPNGGTLEGLIDQPRIVVAAGTTVRYKGEVTLRADVIAIEGSIEGVPSEDGPQPSLVLEATGSVYVAGAVVAPDGSTSQAATSPVGQDGQAGGSITLRAPLVVIAAGAYVRSGDGADGASAKVLAAEGDAGSVSATGGNGGSGGAIVLDAGTVVLNGVLHVGDGGDGGDGVVAANETGLPPGADAILAIGGAGGNPGRIMLPGALDFLALAASGKLRGLRGGDGGDAVAVVLQETPGPDGNGPGSSKRGADGLAGADALSPGGRGSDGSAGIAATARAGDAGPSCLTPVVCVALSGGHGGDATAVGGRGGRGGRGGHGLQDLWFTSSQAIWGGDGGHGADGGYASAYGGDGACGKIVAVNIPYTCGNGGDATIESFGGQGGQGGNGGFANALSAQTRQDCNDRLKCWIPVPEIVEYCGHVGRGGAGGLGRGVAYKGEGGSALLGLGSGSDGSVARTLVHGAAGADGDYDVGRCDHANVHGHRV